MFKSCFGKFDVPLFCHILIRFPLNPPIFDGLTTNSCVQTCQASDPDAGKSFVAFYTQFPSLPNSASFGEARRVWLLDVDGCGFTTLLSSELLACSSKGLVKPFYEPCAAEKI